jgi:hypothetical protein
VVGVEKLKAFFAEVEEGVPIHLAAERSGIGEVYDRGHYRGPITEAAVYVRADRILESYNGESLWDLAASAIHKRGEPEKPSALHSKIISYMGMTRSSMEAVKRGSMNIIGMSPRHAFREVFSMNPSGTVDVDYSGKFITFLLDDDDFIRVAGKNSVIEPSQPRGVVADQAVAIPDLRCRTIAIALDEDWEENLAHERQHARLFNMGYDWRNSMRVIPPEMAGVLVNSYKEYLRDEVVCCMGAEMPPERARERIETATRVLSAKLSRRCVPDDDPARDLVHTGTMIAARAEEAAGILPKEYSVPLLLNHDYDSLGLQLAIHSRVFRTSGRLSPV